MYSQEEFSLIFSLFFFLGKMELDVMAFIRKDILFIAISNHIDAESTN